MLASTVQFSSHDRESHPGNHRRRGDTSRFGAEWPEKKDRPIPQDPTACQYVVDVPLHEHRTETFARYRPLDEDPEGPSPAAP